MGKFDYMNEHFGDVVDMLKDIKTEHNKMNEIFENEVRKAKKERSDAYLELNLMAKQNRGYDERFD